MFRSPSVKRIFLSKSYTAVTRPIFSLSSLASSSGRLDVICRCIIQAFKTRSGLRRNVEFYAVLAGPPGPNMVVHVTRNVSLNVLYSELTVADAIAKSMVSGYYEGVRTFEGNLIDVLKIIGSRRVLPILLHEEGADILSVREEYHKRAAETITIALGTQEDLSRRDVGLLEGAGFMKYSLGPKSYLASHAVILVNYYLDKMLERVEL